MGRAEKRASFRQARKQLPAETRRQLKATSGRHHTYIDRALHPDLPDEAYDDEGAPRPLPVPMTPQPVVTVEEMDRREAELRASIPEVIRDAPETRLMLTRVRSSWMTPVPQAVARRWWSEWEEFLDSRPEARKIHAAQTGLFVPGLSDRGSTSTIITPGGPQ